ncbi:MAG: hypothetical protein IJ232_08970 [Lachnospiraceae bacterium]|nr:hypothetical protein [Lachnospiraceae bacterium]
MDVRFQEDFTDSVEIFLEHSISYNGFSYTFIYGKHINGGFIAIPYWKICCEASSFATDTGYNADKLAQAGLDRGAARAIAIYIKDAMLLKEEIEGVKEGELVG